MSNFTNLEPLNSRQKLRQVPPPHCLLPQPPAIYAHNQAENPPLPITLLSTPPTLTTPPHHNPTKNPLSSRKAQVPQPLTTPTLHRHLNKINRRKDPIVPVRMVPAKEVLQESH